MPQKRGKVNLIGKLQLSNEKTQRADNQAIVELRILRTQEAIIKIMKMRKKLKMEMLQVIENVKNYRVTNSDCNKFCSSLKIHLNLI